MLLFCSGTAGFAPQQYRRVIGQALMRPSIGSSFSSSYSSSLSSSSSFRGAASLGNVGRSMSVWRSRKPSGMSMKAPPGTGKVRKQKKPVGEQPPPNVLHGVFAVYKPKGFTSSDVVQKIKSILCKGARDEFQAKAAAEADAATLNGEGRAEAKPMGDAATAVVSNGDIIPVRPGLGGNRMRTVKQLKLPKGPKIKVGHGGTLDPMATGVLVVGVGKGCREMADYLQGGKSYVAEALLGHETNTQDAEGEATLHGEWEHVTNEAVERALGQFVGNITQVPPMFSALQKDGKRLYQLAREGITVEREARPVTVYSLRQVDPSLPFPRLGLEICSGGGFYVRTVIEDLARVLETRGHMTALERTKQGAFELKHTLAREDWEYDKLCKHLKYTNKWRSLLNPANE